MNRSLPITALIVAGAAAASLAAWMFDTVPWTLGAATAALAAAWLAFAAERRAIKIGWLTVAVLGCSAALFETALSTTGYRAQRVQTFDPVMGFMLDDDTFGRRPAPGRTTRSRLYWGKQTVYDVTYTIDTHGLRASPPGKSGGPHPCALFFGGSYTFGEGVEDDETAAYAFQEETRGAFETRNFGFMGYGPHQMLAAIESGLVERAADCTPRHAVYQAHPHHVLRASGKWWWDVHGPRYVVGDDGGARRSGNFDDPGARPAWLAEPLAELARSGSGSSAAMQILESIQPDAADHELFHAIVGTSAARLSALFPGIEFHVVYWDIDGRELFAETPPPGDRMYRLSEIFPDDPDWQRTALFEHDIHPTAATHRRIAAYLADEIANGDRRSAHPSELPLHRPAT